MRYEIIRPKLIKTWLHVAKMTKWVILGTKMVIFGNFGEAPICKTILKNQPRRCGDCILQQKMLRKAIHE